jgi:spermidine synthase
MKRQGFILGLFSVGGQVLLLRELVSSLNGDELFIGTALCGWLAAVAIGAYVGGRIGRRIRPEWLFVVGAVLIPIMIVAVRLSPLLVTDLTGEIVPFITSVVISILAMLPIGLISGCLFPTITNRMVFPVADAIVVVYLYEGIGAFVGGIGTTIFAGGIVSTFTLSAIIGIVVVASLFFRPRMATAVALSIIVVIFAAAAVIVAPGVDHTIDDWKYRSYDILLSFDTRYGHETLLSREESVTLMTDNKIEAVYPGVESAENQLLAPMLYYPSAKRILYIGRPEFGVAQLADSLQTVRVTALDPRGKLTAVLGNIIPTQGNDVVIQDDPMAYLTTHSVMPRYDIIIVNVGEPDSYRAGRFYSQRFFGVINNWLADDGILLIPTTYDTDRYIAPEKQDVLAVVHQTLALSFPHVGVWPGTMTLFMASRDRDLNLPLDSLSARLDRLDYTPQYVTAASLRSRLGMMSVQRLDAAVAGGKPQTITRPILPHYQALYRSLTDSADRALLHALMRRPWWLIVLPALILCVFVVMLRGSQSNERFGLFLYFIAGLVSLSLELISFYVYQTMAGSLYAELAALIGAFMLGLAAGTYYSHRIGGGPLEFPALIMLAAAILIFMGMYDRIGTDAVIYFHACFLFVTAVATATLFVGATNRYYGDMLAANRGTGYAWELIGSSVGALLTLTLLLPTIGLTWLLIGLILVLALGFAGAVITGAQA